MPDAANGPQTVQFLPPPPRRYRVRVAVEADDLPSIALALREAGLALGPENPVANGVHGGGNWAGALALNPFAARGEKHALEVRRWVEEMPAAQRDGLQRTRSKAVAVGGKFAGGPGDLAQLPGIVETVLGAGLQIPAPATAEEQPSAPEPTLSVPASDVSAQDTVPDAQPQPAARVLTPDPVITNISANEAAPAVAP
jgi:hypothetical protein